MARKNPEIIYALIKAGIPKNAAKCLVVVVQSKKVKSQELEKATSLRQPEVSIAIRYLRKRGWISTDSQKKKGKGRPIHIYKLAKPVTKIAQDINKKQEATIKDIQKNIAIVKNVLG